MVATIILFKPDPRRHSRIDLPHEGAPNAEVVELKVAVVYDALTAPDQIVEEDLDEESSSFWLDLKVAFGSKGFLPIAITFAMTVGAYWTVTTLMNDILIPRGYSVEDIAAPATAFLFTGIPGMFAAGAYIDKTHKYDKGIIISGLLALILIVLFAVVSKLGDSAEHLGILCVICSLGGFFFSALQPMLIEKAAEVKSFVFFP